MKKVLLMFCIMFLYIGTANAETIESQLNELKSNINNLENKINEREINRLDKIYPIGSIFETTTYSTPTQVASALGGTWEVYGSGKTLVGVDSNDDNFNTVNKTGGNAFTTLSVSNLPSHTHSIPALSGSAASAGAHTHSIPALSGSTNSAGAHTHGLTYADDGGTIAHWGIAWKASTTSKANNNYGVSTAGAHTHTVTTVASTSGSSGAHTHTVSTTASTTGSQGSGTSFTNLQPYITVYMYKRVA